MAYMNFSPWHGTAEPALVEVTAADAGHFSPIELRVIDFAQRIDATREIEPDGRFGRFIERVLGIRLGRPLADARLEKLRRFVSLARHHRDALGESDVKALIDSGYSPGQAYGLLAYLLTNGRRQGLAK